MRRSLIAFTTVVSIATTLTLVSLSASASTTHTARPATTATQTCLPAIRETGVERAAQIGTGFRQCTVSSLSSLPSLSAAPDASPVNSIFSFCNSNLACFAAELHFVGKDRFTLSTVQLEKRGCDNRASYADVTDQNGFLGEFENPDCETTADWSGPIEFYDPDGVHYVYIRLYDCNTLTCSSVKNSEYHYNPYW
jgi:hypothetical protein